MGSSVRPTPSGFEDLLPSTTHSDSVEGFDDLLPQRHASVPFREQLAGAGEQVLNVFRHPIDAAEGMLHGIASSASDTFAPVIGTREGSGFALSQRDLDDIERATGHPLSRITAENTPGAVTPDAALLGTANTVANLGLAVAPALAAPARVAVNAGLGALNDQEQHIRGALSGLLLGETVHGLFSIPKGIDVSDGVLASAFKDPALHAEITEPPSAARDALPPRPETTQGKALARAEEIASRPTSLEGFEDLLPSEEPAAPFKVIERRASAAIPEQSRIIRPEDANAQPSQLVGTETGVSGAPLVSLADLIHSETNGPLVDRFGLPPQEPSPNIATREYGARGIGRRPVAELPMSQRPPVEPPAGAETQSFGSETPQITLFRSRPGSPSLEGFEDLLPRNGERPSSPAGPTLPEQSVPVEAVATSRLGGPLYAPEKPQTPLVEAASDPGQIASQRSFVGQRKAPTRFEDARTEGGRLRPLHTIHDDALVRELKDLEAKQSDAEARAQYNWTADDNFHSTEDGRSVMSATRKGGGASMQAKALQNIQDFQRIRENIYRELGSRGLDEGAVNQRILDLHDLDAALEREGIAHAQAHDDAASAFGDATDFDFGGNAGGAHAMPDGFEDLLPASPSARRPSDILNVAKFGLEDQTAEQRIADQLEHYRTLQESQRQTFGEADIDRAAIVHELTSGNPKALSPGAAQRLSGVELLARRDVVASNDALIAHLSKSVESGELPFAEHQQATELLHRAVAQNDALLSDLVTGSSQKGRDLNLLRRIANRTLDPDVWLVQAKRMLGDEPISDTIMADIRRLAREAADACGGAA